MAGIAHDMRAPIGAIVALAECLRQGTAQEEQVRRWAGQILQACGQLRALADGALALCSTGEGRAALRPVPCTAEEIARSACAVAGALAKANEQHLALHLDGPCARQVLGDAARMERIVVNLLTNAVKYTPAGGRIALTVRAREAGSGLALRFAVRDSGMGMDRETLARVFAPYARGKGTAGIEGEGLGLSVARALAQAMGGTLGVKSRPGAGSTFTFAVTLPGTRREAQRAAPKPGEQRRGLAGRTLLLAEDHALSCEVMAELLRERGARVLCARDGAQALACFERSAPGTIDAVLMDMLMPKMDGCSAARAIRALPRGDAGRVPIVALTGAASPEEVQRARESGMDAHALKPIGMDALERLLAPLWPECRDGEAR